MCESPYYTHFPQELVAVGHILVLSTDDADFHGYFSFHFFLDTVSDVPSKASLIIIHKYFPDSSRAGAKFRGGARILFDIFGVSCGGEDACYCPTHAVMFGIT